MAALGGTPPASPARHKSTPYLAASDPDRAAKCAERNPKRLDVLCCVCPVLCLCATCRVTALAGTGSHISPTLAGAPAKPLNCSIMLLSQLLWPHHALRKTPGDFQPRSDQTGPKQANKDKTVDLESPCLRFQLSMFNIQ